jgi:hypothetical protein
MNKIDMKESRAVQTRMRSVFLGLGVSPDTPYELTWVRETVAPCFACDEVRFWTSWFGAVVCRTCHPPASPHTVAEWVVGRAQ